MINCSPQADQNLTLWGPLLLFVHCDRLQIFFVCFVLVTGFVSILWHFSCMYLTRVKCKQWQISCHVCLVSYINRSMSVWCKLRPRSLLCWPDFVANAVIRHSDRSNQWVSFPPYSFDRTSVLVTHLGNNVSLSEDIVTVAISRGIIPRSGVVPKCCSLSFTFV